MEPTEGYILYRKGQYKFQLAQSASIQLEVVSVDEEIVTPFVTLTPGGTLTLKQGYAWDGISGPRFVRDTSSSMRGALTHDALYQLLRGGALPDEYRKEADQEFRRICRLDGMNRFRAWYFYRAVRRFGGSAADQGKKRQVLQAP